MPRKHTLHEIQDTAGRIFEVYCLPNEKEAWRLAKHRLFASSPYHIGIRRVLRIIDGEQWPVLEQEAAYITAARERAERTRQTPSSDPEIQELVKLFHAARVANDQQEQDRLGNLLIQAAQRVERSRLLPLVSQPTTPTLANGFPNDDM
jgi:hypothetical protein